MKIINDKDCYVQREDIEYIIDNSESVPSELFFELNMSILSDNDFIKIENPVAKRFILQSKIPSFDELNNYSISKLEEIIMKIKLSIFDSDDLTSEEIEDINAMILERRNREYLLRQIKEMVAFKKRQSKLIYPNIPNPSYITLTNGVLNAAHSMNYGKVLIYNLNGSLVSSEEDKEFCEVAYQLLMHDYEEGEDINLSMENEGKYLVLENINYKHLKKKYLKNTRQ